MHRTKSRSARPFWLAACIVAYAHFAQAQLEFEPPPYVEPPQYDEPPLIPPNGMVSTPGVVIDPEKRAVYTAGTPYTGPTEPAGSSDKPTSPPPASDEPRSPSPASDEPTSPPPASDEPTSPSPASDELTSPPAAVDEPTSSPPDASAGGSTCAGEVSSCGVLINYCDWQAGCSSSTADGVDICSGTAKDCADITNKDDCTYQVGCNWQPALHDNPPAPPHSRRGSSAVMPVVSWGLLVLVSAQMMMYILV